jgi:hypothetical protein
VAPGPRSAIRNSPERNTDRRGQHGQSRKLEPGSFLFVEDITGKGHKNHLVNDEEVVLAFVPIPDSLMIQNLS